MDHLRTDQGDLDGAWMRFAWERLCDARGASLLTGSLQALNGFCQLPGLPCVAPL